MSKAELIVSHYCRVAQKSLHQFNSSIPSTIVDICLKFYDSFSIINVALGQCGNLIHQMFMESIDQHSNIYSNSKTNNARSILVDLEYGLMDTLKSGGIKYNSSNLIFGCSAACNNWAKGHYTEGAELIDECMDALRNEVESYDYPEGIQIFHALGGGTGSGMGTLMMQKIKDNYPDMSILSFSVFDSPKCGGCVVRPYNMILSLSEMDTYCDGTFVIDNESLWNLSYNMFKWKEPQESALNFISNQMIIDISSLFQYNHEFTIKSFLNEMVKYPELKYFTTSRAPFYDRNGNILATEKFNETDVLQKLFEPKRAFANCDITKGINISTILIYNQQIKQKDNVEFPFKIENDVIEKYIDNPMIDKRSMAMIANSTSVTNVLKRISSQFAKMYKRKAFLHWYKGEGMDEMEFIEAQKCVIDIIADYSDTTRFKTK